MNIAVRVSARLTRSYSLIAIGSDRLQLTIDVWAQHAAPKLAQMFNSMVGDPLSDTTSHTSVSAARFSEGR